jgi:hypothetical protein
MPSGGDNMSDTKRSSATKQPSSTCTPAAKRKIPVRSESSVIPWPIMSTVAGRGVAFSLKGTHGVARDEHEH